jgi:hypothetical protein
MNSLGLIHDPHPGLPRLGAALGLATRATPAGADWHRYIDLTDCDPLGNDTVSNCVECAALRTVQITRAVAADDHRKPSRDQAMSLYGAWSDYPAQDNGTSSADAARLWSSKGIAWGDQFEDVPVIGSIEPGHIKAAIAWLGPVQVDLDMPDSAQGADSWVVGSAPGSWGAHRVCVGRYSPASYWCISWGREFMLTPEFLAKYWLNSEACASRSFLDCRGVSPAGDVWDSLTAAMSALS